MNPRPTRRQLIVLPVALVASAAQGHGARVGDIVIDHPYALPSVAGARSGAAYVLRLRNSGDRAEQLVGARTAVAGAVELHRSTLDGTVMRMRAADAVELPPRSTVSLRHGGQWHLMLLDLKAPLKDGDRFTLTLRFARGGDKDVSVVVQTPRDLQADAHRH